MLMQKDESKSIRVSSVNEDGSEVLVGSASYSNANINLSIDLLDRAYCAAHKDEVRDAITAFMARLNNELAVSGYPLIKTQ